MPEVIGSLQVDRDPPIGRFIRPFQKFAREQVSGGIILLASALVALIWANSPWSDSYHELWETHLRIGFSSWALDEPLEFWINDALMAVFFFVVGLEIKRAVVAGELASPRRAALPVFAALGGMIVPALLYTAINAGGEGSPGWGIPVATDIAFSLGVLALLGSRVPLSLKLFLTAFAIVDDIGAVIVIALFYTDELLWANLGIGFALLGALIIVNRLGVRNHLPYALLATAVWLAFLKSGVHATVAGVLIATTIPIRLRINSQEFAEVNEKYLNDFKADGLSSEGVLTARQQHSVRAIESLCQDIESPLQRMEHSLHPWVAFVIMPLFALANAGVALNMSSLGSAFTNQVTLGVLIGLVVGKQIGITLFTWIAIRAGFAAMPLGVNWRQIYGVAWLGGIGFTMSLFITGLAFDSAVLADDAKIGILGASLIAGVVGWMILRASARRSESEAAASSQVPQPGAADGGN